MKNSNIKITISYILIVLILILVTVTLVNVWYKKSNSNSNGNSNSQNSTENNTKSNDLLITVEDVFKMEESEYQIVFTGRVIQGEVKIGDKVQVLGLGDNYTSKVVKIEQFRKDINSAKAGESVGIRLDNLKDRTDIKRGQVVIKPDSMKSYKSFEADMEITYSKTRGGVGINISSDENIYCYFRTEKSKSSIEYRKNVSTLKKGDKFSSKVELVDDFAMEVGTTFELRNEENEKIGSGVVTKVYE